MEKFLFEPLTTQHLKDATQLLSHQNQRLLEQFPLLPHRISETEVTYLFLQSQISQTESHGVAMIKGGQLIAFLFGSYADNPFFGQHCWVPFGGMAMNDSEPYDTIRNLYAAAGNQWIQDGILAHYLVCPAIPQWLSAGYSLTFGQEQAYAVTSLSQTRPLPSLRKGLTMRAVLPGDAAQLFERGHWIAAHLNSAPVWEPVPQQHLEIILPEYAKLASDPECTTWVVLDEEEIVAYVVLYTVDCGAEHLLGVPTAAHFAAAAVHPSYREKGIGRVLFNQILNIARQQHYQTVFTDWRTTNLQAANYWPSFGFETFAYRLLRRVNPRYQPYHPQTASKG